MCVGTGGWSPVSVWTGAVKLGPTGIRSPNRPARSESLYRLRYPDPPGYCVLLLMRCCIAKVDKTVLAPLRTSCRSKRKAGSGISTRTHLLHSRTESYCRQKANRVINAGNKIRNRWRFWATVTYIPFSPPVFFLVFLPHLLRFPKFQF
jgi:hypothetical protein